MRVNLSFPVLSESVSLRVFITILVLGFLAVGFIGGVIGWHLHPDQPSSIPLVKVDIGSEFLRACDEEAP